MRLIRSLVVAVAFLSFAGAASAHEVGPQPGAHLPVALSAPDSSGAVKSFDDLKGENGLVLMFVRSADWCPFCQGQLVEMERQRPQFELRGYKLAAITTDEPAELARFASRRDIGYPLLADPDFRLVQAFGLTDPAIRGRHAGVPIPTVYVISPDGVIRAQLGDLSFRVRPAPTEVLEAIDNLH